MRATNLCTFALYTNDIYENEAFAWDGRVRLPVRRVAVRVRAAGERA